MSGTAPRAGRGAQSKGAAQAPAARRERRKRAAWPLTLALLYLTTVAVVAGTSRVYAERFWWSTFLLYVPQAVYLAPLPFLVLAALWKRNGRALLASLGALLVVAGVMMGFRVPLGGWGAALTAQGRPRVRVLEYNIRGGLNGYSALEAEIERYRPDVVILAEAAGWSRDDTLKQELARLLPGWQYAEGGDVRVASRWPVVEAEAFPLGTGAVSSPDLDRQKVRVVVQAPFGRFQVVGVHFYTALHGRTLLNQRRRFPAYLRHTGEVRMDQAQDVLSYIERLDGPLILAGDFNTPPAGAIYGRLTERLRDAFAEAGLGWGHTYPSVWTTPTLRGRSYRLPWSMLRIDYVFHSAHWQATASEVGGRAGSDHRPLFAELALTDPSHRP